MTRRFSFISLLRFFLLLDLVEENSVRTYCSCNRCVIFMEEERKNWTGHSSNGLVTCLFSVIVEYLFTNNAKKMLRFSSPSSPAHFVSQIREGKRKERREEKTRRNKFSAMKDSLFLLRSNFFVSGREKPLWKRGRESTISSFIASPPINQYTLRFPIALERFISSIPRPWGAVIFVCTGCALSRPTYINIAGRRISEDACNRL